MKLSQSVTRVVQAIGAKFGVHITRAENTLQMKRQQILNARGIDAVLDVGANVGNYALELRRNGFAGRIISFEPIAEVFASLEQASSRDALWACRCVALGDQDAQRELYVSANLVSSSFREVTQISTDAASATAVSRREQVTVCRLDSIRNTLLKPSDRVYLKVDVQGFEKEVLRGAADTLLQTEAIEIELTLVELYSNQALLSEIFFILGDLGFTLAWLERGFKDPVTGYLLQLDGVFVKNFEAGHADSLQ